MSFTPPPASAGQCRGVPFAKTVNVAAENKTAPRFTVTYVNGQTTPTFRNYNAVLAGFKLPF